MKKLKITGQLVVVFSIIVISSLLIFTLLSFNRIQASSKNLTQSTLYSYVELTEIDWKNGDKIKNNLPKSTAYISGEFKTISEDDEEHPEKRRLEFINLDISTNLYDLFDVEVPYEAILREVRFTPGIQGTTEKKVDNKEYYMSYGVSEEIDGICYFVVFITDQATSYSKATNLSLQIILVFAITMGLAIVVLITWSHYLVNRIKRLQRHISSLKDTNYEEAYVDKGADEVTELANSIETMRLEILQNDKTKQEMLQNISHDFKTPIGVIKSYAEAMQDGHMLDKGPDVIIKQSEILYNKTQQLIIYNKLEYLTHDKEFESVNMRRLIESVENNFKAINPTIKWENSLEDIYFQGYADNYRIVIENILENSLRYAKSLIRITLREDKIEIYNEGEALDEKFIKDGFKAYEKGSKGKFGLGMSIVVKTLSFFGYKLNARNEDVGVTFTISK